MKVKIREESATTELYKRLRPRRLDDVVGQEDAISVIRGYLKKDRVPHTLLLSGPSGTGKTTVARILKRKLGCGDTDFREINAADKNGINDIRAIHARIGRSLAPGSKCRIYLLDEAQRLTPDAQGALLKTLEDTPKWVYFILATTDPEKLRKEIHTRSTHIRFKPVRPKVMNELLTSTAKEEGIRTNQDVIDKIVDVADGSPRKALVLLDQISGIKNKDKQLNVIEKSNLSAQGFNIAQALIYNKGWKVISDLCNNVEEEPETIRRIILSYATKVLLGGGKFSKRAYLVIEAFRDNFYDCGKAGLAAAAFDVCFAK